jgi:hypothetical protein
MNNEDAFEALLKTLWERQTKNNEEQLKRELLSVFGFRPDETTASTQASTPRSVPDDDVTADLDLNSLSTADRAQFQAAVQKSTEKKSIARLF